ncbi:uncharacterized protein LOC111830051 [Capsella rubella]|uniref:uncharacterized protein LOC111830051 n=1 Tax=Capsella rubella TaxID=81985 RepID=UPI000CD4BFB4|nr:uncharacterized protein LOC111830051 [Capsella rubella]
MVPIPYTHVVVGNNGDHKPLNVGTIVFIIETRAIFGRVEGYSFGSVTNPDYVVRLVDTEMHNLHGIDLSFVEEFTQHIDEEDLYKRFHHPTGYKFDFFEEAECDQMGRDSNHYYDSQMAHVPPLQDQHFRSRQTIEPNLDAQDNSNQRFCIQYQPMIYQQKQQFMRPQTNQQNQMGSVPNLVHSQAPMMYQQEQQFMRPETSQQQNIMGNVHRQAPMMPMMYQQEQQFVRPETNQQNQMGSVPNLFPSQAMTMRVADVVVNLRQYLSDHISTILQDRQSGSFYVNQNYSNQQQIGLPEPWPEMNLNTQTQPTMQSQIFNAGPSSYCGRGGGRGRD